MRWMPRRLSVLILAAFASLTCVGPSVAQDQATLPEVLRALGVDQVHADYVIVVDTSGSMEQSHLYAAVKSSLGPLVRSLAPTDHLSLITFDTSPTLRYSGDVGVDAARALNRLPEHATGKSTDLGSAIESGVAELARPGASEIATMILVTDGKHNPPKGSAYPGVSGPAWTALAQKAQAVDNKVAVSAYALALGSEPTDAALLKSVFPHTAVVALPEDQISAYFERMKTDTSTNKAKALVRQDLAHGSVTAVLSGDLNAMDLNNGSASGNMIITSTLKYVPVTVQSPTLSASGGIAIDAAGLPDSLDLAPGQSVRLPVQMTFPPESGFGFGQHPVDKTGQITANGVITSPWSDVITKDLETSFDLKLTSSPTPISGTGVVGWSYGRFGFALAILIVLVWLAWLVRRRSLPRLRGTLTATASGEPPKKVLLSGRVVKIGQCRGSRLAVSGKGRVYGRKIARRGRRAGTELELIIEYSDGEHPKRPGRCKSGSSTIVNGVTFSYHTN